MEISATTSLTFPKTQSLSSFNSSFFNNGGTHLLKTNKRTNCLVLRKRRNRPQRSGFNITCLFGLGVPELAVIAGVAALVFGPKKLPEVGKSLGKTIKSFQQIETIPIVCPLVSR
ncbi:hypothetical protein GIB67_027120 [Kingdonia uniflora]|uniref:Sec-independent protein translocase protein TATA, chloroplastic n=1 Tax=Kingdonia uniflora TaxID=39325 RepID=A0A7J7P1W3_9MAGN|nr:hypothetical protein GIB67_027120 [Kingdonia uniflora]